jgi:hypothetical protein
MMYRRRADFRKMNTSLQMQGAVVEIQGGTTAIYSKIAQNQSSGGLNGRAARPVLKGSWGILHKP